MSKSYNHLTRDERLQTYTHKSNGLSNNKTFRKLGVDMRTVDQEIKRNSGKFGYRVQQANAMAVERYRADSNFGLKYHNFAKFN